MIRTAALTTAALALTQNAARITLNALILRRVRRTHPELFDGAAALASVRACILDYNTEATS